MKTYLDDFIRLYELEKFDEAINVAAKIIPILDSGKLDHALGFEPLCVNFFMMLGHIFGEKDDNEKEIASYKIAEEFLEGEVLRECREYDEERLNIVILQSSANAGKGDFKEAIRLIDQALGLPYFATAEIQFKLKQKKLLSLGLWGGYLSDKNDIDGAILAYGQASELIPYVSHEFDVNHLAHAELLYNLATQYRKKADFEKAKSVFDQALNALSLVPKKHYTERELLRTKIVQGQGLSYKESGDFDFATILYNQALHHNRTNPAAGNRRNDFDLAGLLMDKGNTIQSLGDNDGALSLYDKAFNLINDYPIREEKNDARTLANLFMNQAIAHEAKRNFDKAIELYSSSLTVFSYIQSTFGLQNNLDQFILLLNFGGVFLANGSPQEAFQIFASAEELIDATDQTNLLSTENSRFKLYANFSRLLFFRTDADAWGRAKSSYMMVALELAPPVEVEPWTNMRNCFADFHANWLAYCVEANEHQAIPEILSAIHGREVAAEVLDHLAKAEVGGSKKIPEAARAYQELRRKLRKLSEESSRGGDGLAGTGFDDKPGGHTAGAFGNQTLTMGQLSARQHAEQLRIAKFNALREQLPALREAAAKEPGFEVLSQAHTALDYEWIKSNLRAEEGLLLLINTKHQTGALFIGPDGALAWIAAPGLSNIVRTATGLSHRLGRIRGYRRGGVSSGSEAKETEGSSPVPESFWGDQADAMRTALWEHLDEHLDGVGRLTVITHGDLHGLPVSPGKPEGVELNHFPGIVFFGLKRGFYGELKPPQTTETDLGLITHPGDNVDNAIPLVLAEHAIVADIYRKAGRTVADEVCWPDDPAPLSRLNIAAHGVPGNPVGLNVGQDNILYPGHILGGHGYAGEVYLNCCISGKTVDDPLDGTPSGLIGALFSRGTYLCVASLLSIPDLWAMILSVLVHQCIVKEDLPLDRALEIGKKRLSAGDWYDDTRELLRPHIESWIRGIVREQYAGVSSNPDRDETESMVLGPVILHLGLEENKGRELKETLLSNEIDHENLPAKASVALANAWLTTPKALIPPHIDMGILQHAMLPYGESI